MFSNLFGRSAELTKGSRWKILGLFLVLLVIYWLLTAILGLIGLDTYGAASAETAFTVTNLLGSVVAGTVFNALWGTIQPSLYVELRQAKEGGRGRRSRKGLCVSRSRYSKPEPDRQRVWLMSAFHPLRTPAA